MQSKWTQLGRDKLASSCLTTEDAKKLGMYEVVSAATVDPSFHALPAIVIPYFDLNGKSAAAHPKWPSFYRLRYLGKGSGFADLATDKGQRYAQSAGSGVCAYFPSIVDWEVIAKDVETPIFITEGEFKAAAGCEAGWAAIGLGGVWNFRMAKDGFFFLAELEKVDWVKRNVYICFDSDYSSNPMIANAINRIGDELQERGALTHVLLLPDLEDSGKTGLDDFLLQANAGEFETLIAEAQPIGQARALWKINREVAYVQDPGLVVVLDTGQKMSPAAFKEHSDWSTGVTAVPKLSPDGDIAMKKEPAAPIWLKWPLRQSVKKVTYSPGEPRITEDGEYNQWTGWGVVPKKGSVKPFLDLVKFLFKDMEKGLMDWFLDWCAYPIQNPGVKMFTSVLIWGAQEGTGKSLVGYSLGRVYGDNFKEITDEDLDSDYTAWAENKSFIMGDDVTGSDNRHFANKLKRLITQRSISINIKHLPHYTVPDCINYLFTANFADAFFLSDKDRRNFICEVVGDALPEKFYKEYDKWIWGEGASALFHWLLERKISKTFNPSANAPKSSAKERMILAGKGELSAWIRGLMDHPSQVLRTGKMRHTKDLWSAGELLSFYKSQHPDGKATSTGIGKALSSAGISQAAGGAPLRGPDGNMNRYYIIRNVGKWRKTESRKLLEAELKRKPVPIGTVEDEE